MVDISVIARDARSGDRDALARLVTVLQADVWRFCLYAGESENPTGLAHDALISIVANLHRWGSGPVTTWALGVTRATCLDRARRDRRRGPTQTAPGPLRDQHTDTTVWRLLRSLPMEEREAVVLTQLIGLPYTEASQVLGCSVVAVRARVATGRGLLAGGLNGSDWSAEG